MVHFVGAGCGTADLITVRGRRLLEEADVVLYAGSLVNPDLLSCTKKGCRLYNSAKMTLEEIGRRFLRRRKRGLSRSACIQGIRRFTARSESRLIFWTATGLRMTFVWASAPFAVLPRRCGLNIRRLAYHRALSSHGSRDGPPCRRANRSAPLPRMARRW